MTLPILGLIAGGGELPQQIIDSYTKQSGECVVASVAGSEFEAQQQKNFAIGEVGKIISYFKTNNVQKVVIIGGITRPDLSSLKVDLMGSLLLGKIAAKSIRGDDNVLRIVAEFLESKGFEVVTPTAFLEEQALALSNTTHKPNAAEIEDIKLGQKILNSLDPFDIGQSIIIQDGYVIGIEAAEGTDALIARCAKLRKQPKGGVLVKIVKPSQDQRLDIPTIGPTTILNLQENNFSGLAISHHGIIIAEHKKVLQILQNSTMFCFSIGTNA